MLLLCSARHPPNHWSLAVQRSRASFGVWVRASLYSCLYHPELVAGRSTAAYVFAVIIAFNRARRLRLIPTYILRVLWASLTYAQSNNSICEHTESEASTRSACDASALVASSGSSVPRTPASILLMHDGAVLLVVLRPCVGASPSPVLHHYLAAVVGATAPAWLPSSRGPCAVGQSPCLSLLSSRGSGRCAGRALAPVQRRSGGVGILFLDLLPRCEPLQWARHILELDAPDRHSFDQGLVSEPRIPHIGRARGRRM